MHTVKRRPLLALVVMIIAIAMIKKTILLISKLKDKLHVAVDRCCNLNISHIKIRDCDREMLQRQIVSSRRQNIG